MHIEDAEKLLVRYLLDHPGNLDDLGRHGFDLFLPGALSTVLASKLSSHSSERARELEEWSEPFYAAAWELCRRGILRPGLRRHKQNFSNLEGAAGAGFCVTPLGRQWLSEPMRDDFMPAEPQRFAQMLGQYQARFGPGFQSRAQEAMRCYSANATLACCAMCGAAAESILLAAAIEKRGEQKTLKEYLTASGRGRITRDLVAPLDEYLRDEFEKHVYLLKYWRDESAHGRASLINENEAYTSLVMLLRFANLVKVHWEELTRRRA